MMGYFNQDPSFEIAREVFLTCRRYKYPTPDEVLDVIAERLKSDKEQLEKKHKKRTIDTPDKRLPDEFLLNCALEADTLEAAYDSYREKAKEAVDDGALRKRLERYLDGKITSLCKNEFDCEPSQLPVILPTKLSLKLSFYKDLLSSIPWEV
jgi:hypothetical protein